MPVKYEVGDIVFSRIDNFIFNKVATSSLCWSNHVGLIVGYENDDYVIAESILPFSKTGPLKKYIERSYHSQYAVKRLKGGLSEQQKEAICQQIPDRMGRFYSTGFKLESHLQFCSKLVYEVYRDALSIEIGKVETFEELLTTNPNADLTFWRLWFFGNIPWQRKTVTPASQWHCPRLETIFVSDPDLLNSEKMLKI